HLLDQYQRGAMAEMLGFIWMPLMLGAGERLMGEWRGRSGAAGLREGEGSEGGEEGGGEAGGGKGEGWGKRLRWVMVLGASYGGFIWSHPPTAYQFSLGFVVGM